MKYERLIYAQTSIDIIRVLTESQKTEVLEVLEVSLWYITTQSSSSLY